jgi:hypothetical protein
LHFVFVDLRQFLKYFCYVQKRCTNGDTAPLRWLHAVSQNMVLTACFLHVAMGCVKVCIHSLYEHLSTLASSIKNTWNFIWHLVKFILYLGLKSVFSFMVLPELLKIKNRKPASSIIVNIDVSNSFLNHEFFQICFFFLFKIISTKLQFLHGNTKVAWICTLFIGRRRLHQIHQGGYLSSAN